MYDVDKLLSNLLELVKIRRSAAIQRFSWENIYIQGQWIMEKITLYKNGKFSGRPIPPSGRRKWLKSK